jgi:YHS domain-containing protein
LAPAFQAHAESKYPRWSGGTIQLKGYDATSYFQTGRAKSGTLGNVVKWNGGTWHFASPKEAELFKSKPSSFAPQFGAYCTGGLSQHHVVDGNARFWRMHKGRLYLFYSRAGARRFDKDPAGTIAAARAYAKTVGIVESD